MRWFSKFAVTCTQAEFVNDGDKTIQKFIVSYPRRSIAGHVYSICTLGKSLQFGRVVTVVAMEMLKDYALRWVTSGMEKDHSYERMTRGCFSVEFRSFEGFFLSAFKHGTYCNTGCEDGSVFLSHVNIVPKLAECDCNLSAVK